MEGHLFCFLHQSHVCLYFVGDLWSYNFDNRQYAISPDPDVDVVDFNPYQQKCLVLATDGMWNLIDAKAAIKTVEMTERKWFREAIYEKVSKVSAS